MRNNRAWAWNIAVSFFFLTFVGVIILLVWNFNRKADPRELFIFSGFNYTPDRPISLVVLTRNAKTETGIQHAKIRLFVDDKEIAPVVTGLDGTALVNIKQHPNDSFELTAHWGGYVVKKHISVGHCRFKYLKATDAKKTVKKQVQIKTDKTFYAPGDTINAQVKVPLPEKTMCKVSCLLTFMVPYKKGEGIFDALSEVLDEVPYRTFKTVVDARGVLSFKIKLPKTFKGIDFNEEDSVCHLKIESTEKTKLNVNRKLKVTNRPVTIRYFDDCNDRYYFLVTDAVGKALEVKFKVAGKDYKTDKNGLALVTSTTTDFDVSSKVPGFGKVYKRMGNREYKVFKLTTDKFIYNPGDKVKLDVYARNAKRGWVNIASNDGSIKIEPVEIVEGKGTLEFDIPTNLKGLLWFSVYGIAPESNVLSFFDEARGRIVVQSGISGKDCYFSSPHEMILARLGLPEKNIYKDAKRYWGNSIFKKSSLSHDSRKKNLKSSKKKIAKYTVMSTLITLFSIFLILLYFFARLWFYPPYGNFAFAVPEKIKIKALNNAIFAIAGGVTMVVSYVFAAGVINAEYLRGITILMFSNPVVLICNIIYWGLLLVLIWRSFRLRNLLLKVELKENGEKLKRSVFFLPYLFIIFFLFEHTYWFGYGYVKHIDWLWVFFFSFQAFAVIWLFCAWGINSFLYTREEYDSMVKYKAASEHCRKNSIRQGMGEGLGVYPHSALKVWVMGGLVYWGLPFMVYFWIFLVIIALFLPLFVIMEKLG